MAALALLGLSLLAVSSVPPHPATSATTNPVANPAVKLVSKPAPNAASTVAKKKIKLPPAAWLPLGARVSIAREDGAFLFGVGPGRC